MPSLFRAAIATSVMAVAVFVNASAVSGPVAKKAAPQEAAGSLKAFVSQLLEEGRAGTIKGFALTLGFERPGVTYKSYEIEEDGLQKACGIAYELDEAGQPKPVCLLVGKGHKKAGVRTFTWWRVGLEGELEKALVSVSKLNEEGKVVRGSAVYTNLDPKSPDVLSSMNKELSFWLKRQKATAKAAAGGPTARAKAAPSSSK